MRNRRAAYFSRQQQRESHPRSRAHRPWRGRHPAPVQVGKDGNNSNRQTDSNRKPGEQAPSIEAENIQQRADHISRHDEKQAQQNEGYRSSRNIPSRKILDRQPSVRMQCSPRVYCLNRTRKRVKNGKSGDRNPPHPRNRRFTGSGVRHGGSARLRGIESLGTSSSVGREHPRSGSQVGASNRTTRRCSSNA
jgi:hypothetical protein